MAAWSADMPLNESQMERAARELCKLMKWDPRTPGTMEAAAHELRMYELCRLAYEAGKLGVEVGERD